MEKLKNIDKQFISGNRICCRPRSAIGAKLTGNVQILNGKM